MSFDLFFCNYLAFYLFNNLVYSDDVGVLSLAPAAIIIYYRLQNVFMSFVFSSRFFPVLSVRSNSYLFLVAIDIPTLITTIR